MRFLRRKLDPDAVLADIRQGIIECADRREFGEPAALPGDKRCPSAIPDLAAAYDALATATGRPRFDRLSLMSPVELQDEINRLRSKRRDVAARLP